MKHVFAADRSLNAANRRMVLAEMEIKTAILRGARDIELTVMATEVIRALVEFGKQDLRRYLRRESA